MMKMMAVPQTLSRIRPATRILVAATLVAGAVQGLRGFLAAIVLAVAQVYVDLTMRG